MAVKKAAIECKAAPAECAVCCRKGTTMKGSQICRVSKLGSLPTLSTNRPNCENQSPDPSQLPRCPRSFCREVSGFHSVVRHEQRLQMRTATPNTGLRATHSRTQVSATLTVEHRTGTSIPTGLTGTKLVVSGSMSDTPPRKTKCGLRQHCSQNPSD